MDDLPPDISPEDYAAFVDNLKAYFEASRAAGHEGGAAADSPEDSPGAGIEADLVRLFAGGLPRELDPSFLDSLIGALQALAPDSSAGSVPGWAEVVALLFRYEQDFLMDLEELGLPESRKAALRRQMVGFFRGLARQLSNHLGGRTDTGSLASLTGWTATGSPQGDGLGPQLLGALRDPICRVDGAGLVLYANPAFRQALPPGTEPLGLPVSRWLHWEGDVDAHPRQGHLGNGSHSMSVQGIQVPEPGGGSLLVLQPTTPGANGTAPHDFPHDNELRAENQRLRTIYRAWVGLGAASTEEELIPGFLRRLGEAVPYGAAALLLSEGTLPRIWTTLTADRAAGWTGLPDRLAQSLVLFAPQTILGAPGRPRHLGIPGQEPVPDTLPAAESLALPLVAGDRVWGVVVLYRPDGSGYSSQEVQATAILAHGLAATWRQLLTTRALQRTSDHLQQELRFARRVQRNFLPQPVTHPRLRITTRFVPASTLSGDFYLFDQEGDGPVTVLIGDVAGHGIPAALMMMAMVGICTELLPSARTRFPELLPLANIACCQILEENYFVTAQALRIDPAHRRAWLASAGHPPALHVGAGGCAYVEATGLPLGMFPDATYGVRELALEPGDRLLLYTDGAVEARDGSGRPFGRERLRLAATDHCGEPAGQLLDGLVTAAQRHTGRPHLLDDAALICVELL
ncbi:MAG TPA: SpoIIE family protein phosphatase [bacterium]|nr:SpoIIE family protein phosphatase [bacterium]